jgi:hypothetical protein
MGEVDDDDDETTATRFTRRLLKHFLKGFEAKDKNVRYRVVCFVAEVISQFGELEYVVFLWYPVDYERSCQRGYVQLPSGRATRACP